MRKSPGQRYDFFLVEMRDAMERIILYSEDIHSEAEFTINGLHRDAMIRNFEILGECVKHIPFRFQKRFPHIPWSQMLFLRNFIVHEFFDIDDAIIWSIVQTDLKKNLLDFNRMIADENF